MPAFMHLFAAVLATYAVAQSTAQIEWNGKNWAMGCTFLDTGKIIQQLPMAGKDCGPSCDSMQDCTHFMWTRANGGTCSLMSGNADKANARQITEDGAVCGVSPGHLTASTSGGINWKGTWALGCDFPSGDFKQIQTEPETGKNCGPTCDATPGCTHFFWKQGTCYLKSGPVSKSRAVPLDDFTVVCGLAAGVIDDKVPDSRPIHWNGNWAMSCDFQERGYQSVKIEGKDCGPRCDAEPPCTHFAWSNLGGGTCRLMSGPGSKNDALRILDSQAVCGVKSKLIDWTKEGWAHSCYFQIGNELSVKSAPGGDQCRERCVANLECSHFTWTDGSCKLMGGEISKADAVPNNMETICGVISCSSSALMAVGQVKCALTAALVLAALLVM